MAVEREQQLDGVMGMEAADRPRSPDEQARRPQEDRWVVRPSRSREHGVSVPQSRLTSERVEHEDSEQATAGGAEGYWRPRSSAATVISLPPPVISML